MDGRASGAIVNYYATRAGEKIELQGIDYGESIKLSELEDHTDNSIVICDFSFNPKLMLELLKLQSRVIWLDHHKSSIEQSEQHGYDDLDGRRAIGQAACELTWSYFFPDVVTPKGITLLGRYDVWSYEDNNDVLPFQYGVRLYHNHPQNDSFWHPILLNDQTTIAKHIAEGQTILRFKEIENRNLINSASYVITFHGLRFLCINRGGANSLLFKDYKKSLREIDGLLTYCYDGHSHLWRVSMYQARHRKEDYIDILSIAKSYGGGGHIGACGFTMKELPTELIA
jgi:oligoribonuclease NrnB/cAMP/cGMP phosphodiesterase (DHH superfamily)